MTACVIITQNSLQFTLITNTISSIQDSEKLNSI